VDRQVAHEPESIVVDVFDASALEGDGRVRLGVEEVGRPQVRIALRIARVDAGGRDRDVDERGRRIVIGRLNRAGHVREAAFHGRDHHVPDRELDVAVRGVDRPRGDGGRLGAGGGAHRILHSE
jgi:hypothetical protein